LQILLFFNERIVIMTMLVYILAIHDAHREFRSKTK